MPDLRAAIDLAGRVVDGVRPEQWDKPTGCTDWSVRQLLDHLVGGQLLFARVLAGEPFEAALAMREADQLGDDPTGAYRASAERLLEAAARPGVLERPVRVPFGLVPGMVALHLRTVEALVHGWDLARATGQLFAVPDELAEAELAFSHENLTRVPPDRRPFGEPQPAPDDAPAIDRLVALLGRPLS